MAASDPSHHRVRSPWLPTWSMVRTLLELWDGVPAADIDGMWRDVIAQAGTPQAPVDWSDPDTWIAERLSGSSRALADRIWQGSARTVNPRYVHGSMLFARLYELMATGADGKNRTTDRGKRFLVKGSDVEREIDEAEGLRYLARLIAKKNRPRRQDLLPEWTDYLRKHSRFHSGATIKSTLSFRVRNLRDRGLLEPAGTAYALAPDGRAFASLADAEPDERQRLLDAVARYNEAQKKRLHATLLKMHPYAFEYLARDLLTEMGYEDATVTKQSGDKGIDVVANVQVGITSVRDVVQVKRVQGNLNRTVLDQLRGVLPFHGAIRGTVITTGGFSKGCTEVATYQGAAPLTLIDGDRLIDLMVEHGVGIAKEAVDVLELTDLESSDDEAGMDDELAS